VLTLATSSAHERFGDHPTIAIIPVAFIVLQTILNLAAQKTCRRRQVSIGEGVLLVLAGLVLAADMLAAYISADLAAFLSFFSNPAKFYGAAPYTFLFAALLVLVFGPGKISVDHLLFWRYQKTRKTHPPSGRYREEAYVRFPPLPVYTAANLPIRANRA
jgi:hypothetical protein